MLASIATRIGGGLRCFWNARMDFDDHGFRRCAGGLGIGECHLIGVVRVTVSDGAGGSDVQTITVNVTDVADGIVRVTPVALAPIGGETLVNTATANAQSIGAGVSQAMASDASGNYIVVWQSDLQDGSGSGIYAQQFNAELVRIQPPR